MSKLIVQTTITTLLISIFLYVFSLSKVEAFGGGTGTLGDPYVITTCSQLQNIQDHSSSSFVLGSDIDCSETITWNQVGAEYRGFEPIGDSGNVFEGVLDGMGFTIYNLFINRPTEDHVGLFNAMADAIVRDLTFQESYVRGNEMVGTLVGESYDGSYFNNVNVINSIVIGEGLIFFGTAGGLVGYSEGSIIFEECSFDGTVTGIQRVGGFIGTVFNHSGEGEVHIIDSYNAGSISGRGEIGGLVGSSSAPIYITNSYNTGLVFGYFRVGGLVGYSDKDISITDSYNSGNISGYYRVGGLVGGVEEKVTLLSSYNEGGISSILEDYDSVIYDIPIWIDEFICIGGLVGASWKTDISKSYNKGHLLAIGGSRSVGGILGCGGLVDIQETYNNGDIETELTVSRLMQLDGIGGLVGMAVNMKVKNSYNAGNLNISYWDDCTEDFVCGFFPYSGGLVGTSIVSSVRNSYNRGNITIADSQEELTDGGVGGLLGFLYMDEWTVGEVVREYSKDFVARATTYITELINNFAVGLITNMHTGNDVAVGGLVGVFMAGNCTTNNCIDEISKITGGLMV